MKKIIAILMAAVMAAGLLAGCGSSPAAADTTEAATEAAAAETTAAATEAATTAAAEETAPAEEEHPYYLCDEKTTLTVTTYDGANSGYEPPSNDDPFWQWMEEQTNVHIEWEVIPYAGYNEVIQARLAAGEDLADIINVYGSDNGQSAGSNGLLLDMAPYWDTCFTNVQQFMQDYGVDYKSLISSGDGAIYTLTGISEPVEGHRVIMYNKEWMDKLGLEMPKTLDEFNAVLEAMKAAGDINGNGEDDEIVLTSQSIRAMNAIIGNAFGLENYNYWDAFAAGDDGVVFAEDTSENFRKMMAYEADLYKKGILDPEIATMTADLLSEKIAADRVGIFVYYSAFSFSYGELTTKGQEDPYAEIYTLGYPLASEYNNNEAYFVRWENAKSCPTGISAASENAELACKWLDFLIGSYPAVYRRTLGIEGEHYAIEDDGSITYIFPTDGSDWNGSGVNAGQITLPYVQTKDQLLVTKAVYPWYLDQYAELRDNCKWISPSVPHPNYYATDEQEIVNLYKADYLAYDNEMQAKFVTGEADVEKDWDTFVSTMDQLGLQELIGVYQGVHDRMR